MYFLQFRAPQLGAASSSSFALHIGALKPESPMFDVPAFLQERVALSHSLATRSLGSGVQRSGFTVLVFKV